MLSIEPIPAFDDNYIWLLQEPPGSGVAVVDPGDADPVIETLRARGLDLTAVLVTHHHQDHIGGLDELRQVWPDLLITGPADRRIRALTRVVGEGEQVRLPGFTTDFQVMAVPGHTASHIAYLGDANLFCGDTLFAAGCGRVFDGTFAQLAASLRRIAALPATTLCYCAHEYTLANLGFARWVEPDSPALLDRSAAAARQRRAGQPTVPSTLALELATNPFLRTSEPAVIAAAADFAGHPLADPTAVFTALRRWKDERYD
ncbi:MAG: hydroxyacylglutathione hydrolase [Chromatiaceae bacterium]|nr:MAG: hydroxyacylglutathione hydrolase [Chromatiaceae bacterium]